MVHTEGTYDQIKVVLAGGGITRTWHQSPSSRDEPPISPFFVHILGAHPLATALHMQHTVRMCHLHGVDFA